MDTNQIKSLINQGFEFGAHSIDHPLFAELDTSKQLYQLEQSIKDITLKFNLDYKLFSFPFTDYKVTMNLFNAIFDKNAPISDLTFGSAGLKNDSCIQNIQRIAIERDGFLAQEVIYHEYVYCILRSFFNKGTINRN